MSVKIKTIKSTDAPAWDAYVYNHPKANLYHLSGWKNAIEKTYGHKTYYLMAVENIVNRKQRKENRKQRKETHNQQPVTHHKPSAITCQQPAMSYELSSIQVAGILPLVHLKHFLFGNNLVSIPYFDMGGILADNDEIEKDLLCEAIKLGKKLKVDNMELRHIKPIPCLNGGSKLNAQSSKDNSTNYELSAISHELSAISYLTKSHKVRMLLDLPESSATLMKSFKSKLRSQIKKPVKEGLKAKIGSLELLDDFYKVFLINMRDLGSPVHSKRLIENVLKEFPDKAKIVVVYKGTQPVASSMIVGFKGTLENPWASALRQYSQLAPNMLLYWTMIEYASDNGYAYFDFGRSSPDEGTYKFKKQWGAKPEPLHWHYISPNSQPIDEETSEKSKFGKAIQCWQKLPVSLTKIIGPRMRKHIGL